jgi:sortase A
MARRRRLLGGLLLGAGVLVGAWTLTVYLWQDPFTALYTSYEQGKLAAGLHRQFATFPRRRIHAAGSVASEQELVAAAARRDEARLRSGQPIGRIIVPRMSLNMIVVDGTNESSLAKGPGRYLGSAMPGEGQLVYIAGHRTTFLAPFSNIDQMRKGDRITFELPYATFVYRVTGYRIVPATDLAVLRSPGHELLELQACHPRFSASHRFIVYALPVRVTPRGGKGFRPTLNTARQLARAAPST